MPEGVATIDEAPAFSELPTMQNQPPVLMDALKYPHITPQTNHWHFIPNALKNEFTIDIPKFAAGNVKKILS